MDEREEPLACPFCGKRAVRGMRGDMHIVHCEDRFDSCPVNMRTHLFPTEEEAVCAWNRRADPRLPQPDTPEEDAAHEAASLAVEAYVAEMVDGDEKVVTISKEIAAAVIDALRAAFQREPSDG